MTTRLVLLGDSPRQRSGLGRIAHDIALMTYAALAEHHTQRPHDAVDALQIGWEDLEADFTYPPVLPFIPLSYLGQDWGATSVAQILRQLHQDDPAERTILWIIWDPARGFPYLDLPEVQDGTWELWAYPAIDAANRHQQIGGPAGAYLTDPRVRVLAYGPYGASIIRNTRAAAGLAGGVSWLPHGHHWTPNIVQAHTVAPPTDRLILGCVATNQPRKDLGLFMDVLARLRTHSGTAWHGWLHTDRLVTAAWSIPELLDVYRIPQDAITLTSNLTDPQLIAHYTQCAITLAPGRGEGFGYPIVESLACGVPAVHARHGGGADLLPDAWCVGAYAHDSTNPYVLERPILHPDDVHATIRRIHAAWAGNRPELRHYCQTLADRYSWRHLNTRWKAWILQGLAPQSKES